MCVKIVVKCADGCLQSTYSHIFRLWLSEFPARNDAEQLYFIILVMSRFCLSICMKMAVYFIKLVHQIILVF